MKRNKNLIELSKDHHHGLLLGWKIKQGLKLGTSLKEMVNYINHFATEALYPHFDEEENQLLPFIDAEDSFRKRTLEEHRELKQLIASLSDSSTGDTLLNLAAVLEAHIRFEERELFPYIETLLSEEQLDEIGKLITDLHQPYIENYPNEFWNR